MNLFAVCPECQEKEVYGLMLPLITYRDKVRNTLTDSHLILYWECNVCGYEVKPRKGER